ncbi:enoyl-CoA hydratase [Streptomyces malaysiensis]|uniref:Enoyl-CoA hydratase n=2 Tax=Streptomyces malaysiensis TaxID=92644 RepID=A0A7X6AW01_STRMQ|nr:enoyl-CoA hydratase [Streptomyces malaysiensis]
MALADLVGADLGTRRMAYREEDAILYALAVGTPADQLDLVFERNLRVLPTYGLVLGLWVADAAGALGAFRPQDALHGAQTLNVHKPLPPEGEIDVHGRVAAVWDKGSAAVLEVVAECDHFTAGYSIFLPRQGGWGGERGPSAVRADNPAPVGPVWSGSYATSAQQAALYRLTGDRHLIHIDPEAAHAAGLPGVILHGLCTLGIAAREVAEAAGARPWELASLRARFTAPVRPGDTIALSCRRGGDGAIAFTAQAAGATVLSGGSAVYSPQGAADPG